MTPYHRFSTVIRALWALAMPALAQIPTGVGFKPAFQTDGANKFTWPVAMEEIPGAEGSFLVLEKNSGGSADSARIWRIAPGSGLQYVKALFATLSVSSDNVSNGELGLLGVAFHPKFRENRKYYVDYNPPGGRIHAVDERQFNAGFTADAGTAKRIIVIPTADGHNGGGIAFGPDGFLYVSAGDATDPTNGQKRSTMNGKILRLDVDGPTEGRAYGIPADNPFQAAGQRPEIFAMGFRNPWRISFDPITGDLWAGDVGLGTFEEVDKVIKGGNYGWAAFEGSQGGGGPCSTATCLPPATLYGRTQGRSIIGGHVYRGDPLSRFYGVYIFGDYEYNGPVYGFAVNGTSGSQVKLGELGKAISGVGRDSRNNVYVIGHDNGILYRLEHAELRESPTGISIDKPGRPSRLRVDIRAGILYLHRGTGSDAALGLTGRQVTAHGLKRP